MKIMLADDEMMIVKIVQRIVLDMGYDFVYALNGKEAISVFFEENPDLLILDVMMPRMDGYDVCSIIREKSDVPIIFLSAKSDIVDKSVGFKMGADDYLIKPFSSLELQLRIQALLRRSQDKVEKNVNNDIFTYKSLTINFNTYDVMVDGEPVVLTMKEFAILALLAKNQGQVFTRNQLLDSIWGKNYIGDFNSLTVLIGRIRDKIEKDNSNPEYIETVWGIGYRFAK